MKLEVFNPISIFVFKIKLASLSSIFLGPQREKSSRSPFGSRLSLLRKNNFFRLSCGNDFKLGYFINRLR